ncbi:MAG: cation transporter [Acidobacteria bacterium]|nr:cation transporter [Acidobacteriota bacterium]
MTTLIITGMTCGHCAMAVKKALLAVPGVLAAEVDQPLGEARVEGSAPPALLLAAVEGEGYGARMR